MTVDLRNTDDAVLREAERRVARHADWVAAEEGVTIERRSLARFAPVEFDTTVVGMVESAADARGYPHRRMPSGAGHDAQMLARVCPTGMVFVPSRQGVSHNPAEYTEPDHLAAGVEVLADVLLRLAG
jgi:N-carbamoyl-L-amino-acid hydrolase